MSLSNTEKKFLNILKIAINGEQFTEEIEKTEWVEIFRMAEKQKLLPIIFEASRKNPSLQQESTVCAVNKQITVSQVARQIAGNIDFRTLYDELRQEGLHPLAIKGPLCASLYPSPDFRITADVDLLIAPEELEQCDQSLRKRGLTREAELSSDEITYVDDYTYLELHQRLFDSSPDAPDDLNAPFARVFDRMREKDGFLTMSAQDHLLYLILHAYKHFIYSGVGLRQVVDIGLWGREYAAEVDWEQLRAACRQVHGDVFAGAVFGIAEQYLGLRVPGCWQTDRDLEPMLEDMFGGGVFGSDSLMRVHTSTVTLNAIRSDRLGQRPSVWRSIFPNRRYMQGRYPWLKGRGFLLPVAWLCRMAHYAWELLHKTHDRPGESVRLGRERIRLLRRYGVMDETPGNRGK